MPISADTPVRDLWTNKNPSVSDMSAWVKIAMGTN